MSSLSGITKMLNTINFFSKLDENTLQALQQKLRFVMSPISEELGRAGQITGEMSLFGEMNRSASLKAKEETGAWVLDRDEFQNIFETHAASGDAFLVVIADHLDQEKSSGAKFLSKDLSPRPRIVKIALFDTKPSMRAACKKGNNTRYNIVVDRATGLVRQNKSGMKSGFNANLTPEDVQAYIKRLNQKRFAGYDNWRLPTIEELRSLLEPEAQAQEAHINPIFDATWMWN